MKLSSVRRDNTSLSNKAVEQIIQFIQENQLDVGNRLPNEKELEARLNVSRGTIREAMRSLSSRGIVVIRQGSGTYISNSPGVAEDPLGLAFKYDKEKVMSDLLEIRFMMEPSIAACSAMRASGEDKKEILSLADKVADCIKSGVDHTEQDVAFHCKIAESTGNDILTVLIPEIVKGIRLFSQVLEDRILHEVVGAHGRIAQAISEMDAEKAYKAMLAHLESNRIAIEAYIRQQENYKLEGSKIYENRFYRLGYYGKAHGKESAESGL